MAKSGTIQTFLVPVADEARKNQLGVKKTKDVVIVEQDDEMLLQNKPIDEDMAQYWQADIDLSNADTVCSFDSLQFSIIF